MIFAGAIVLFSTCYFKKGTQIMLPSQSTSWYLNRKLDTYLYVIICAHHRQHPASSDTKVHSLTYYYFQLHTFLYANSTSYTSLLWECLRGIIFTCNQRSVNTLEYAFEDWLCALLVLVMHAWKEREPDRAGMLCCL